MRDVGVGRSGGLTNWYLMNVADMWACVQDHQTEQHWRHVAGWRKVCDLAGQHLTRLRAYRDGLARAWPPETNAAAKAYVAELDDLIDQVQRTHDAASANQTALSAATQAITSTRTELGKIYEEYARKLQQKRTWETIAADPKAAAGSRASEPPVTDAELERLNVRARGIMYGLSSELQQAQAMLRQPPSSPRPAIQPARDHSSEGQTAGGIAAPIIPPIVPIPNNPSAGSRSRAPSLSPGKSALTPGLPQTGPVLGGANPGSALSTPPAPAAESLGPPPSPNTAPQPPLSGVRTTIPGIGPAPGEQNGRARAASPAAPSRTGGVIGGLSVPGTTRPPMSNGGEIRRVNPIGGMIGGGGAGTAPTGAAGSRPGNGRGAGGGSLMTPSNGTLSNFGTMHPGSIGKLPRGKKDDAEESRRWDPDHPWRTDQGVSPIVRPSDEEGPIDPGPAIGLDR